MHRKEIVRCNIISQCAGGEIQVELVEPLSALVCPGQFAVFYDGEECIGSALITHKEMFASVARAVTDLSKVCA